MDMMTQPQPPNLVDVGLDRINLALNRLEVGWRTNHDQDARARSQQAQLSEQHIQALKVQAAHWKAEAEKYAAQLRQQNDLEVRLTSAEANLHQQRQLAQQWQEKAESWKEEARRAEEARIAALYSAGSAEVKNIASQINEYLEDAIGHLRQIIKTRTAKMEASG